MVAQGSTLLLVEKEPVVRDITAFRLELLGYPVVVKESAAQASEYLTHGLPALIAVGQLADVDPIDFVNRLSDDERTSGVPVIYLSASSDLEAVQRAFNAGADEYLVTPYDPLVLEQKVGDLVAAGTSAATAR